MLCFKALIGVKSLISPANLLLIVNPLTSLIDSDHINRRIKKLYYFLLVIDRLV